MKNKLYMVITREDGDYVEIVVAPNREAAVQDVLENSELMGGYSRSSANVRWFRKPLKDISKLPVGIIKDAWDGISSEYFTYETFNELMLDAV